MAFRRRCAHDCLLSVSARATHCAAQESARGSSCRRSDLENGGRVAYQAQAVRSRYGFERDRAYRSNPSPPQATGFSVKGRSRCRRGLLRALLNLATR